MRQAGVNARKWGLLTFIVSDIDFAHFLMSRPEDKTNQSDYPISPQALVLFCWSKAEGLSGKKMTASLTKLQTIKLLSTPCRSFFFFYNLFFPLQPARAPKARNTLSFAKISES